MCVLQHVLAQPQNWCVQTAALLLRSQWEKGSARRLHRSLAQLEVNILCILVYCSLHGLGPEYFSEDFRLVSEIHSRQRLHSASSTDVVVPATRWSSLGDCAFPVTGARAWNALPPNIPSAPPLSLFWRLLKTFLFQRQSIILITAWWS